MPSSTKYIPFGPNGAVAFWARANDKIQNQDELRAWADLGIKTVVCVFSEKGSSIVTELEEVLHAGDWKLFALEIPPGPETNESVFYSAWKLISAASKSNILFLIPEELEKRWEVILSKMVISSYPHIATGELGAWFPSLQGEAESEFLGEFKTYASRKKAPKEIPDSTRGEFSIYLKELPLAISGIELGVFKNGHKDTNGKKKIPKFQEPESLRTLESKPVISFDTVFSGEKQGSEIAEPVAAEEPKVPVTSEKKNIPKREITHTYSG